MKPKDFLGDLQQLSLGLDVMEARDDDCHLSQEEMDRISDMARVAFEAKPELTANQDMSGSWFEDYARLRTLGYPWRVATWIAWAASPRVNRWPKTQEELATKVLGLTSDRVIGKWRTKYPNLDAIVALMQAIPLMEYRRDMFEALAWSASQKDHRSNPDRKLFAEMTGDHVPHMTVEDRRKAGNRDLHSKTDAELEALEATLLADEMPDRESPLTQPLPEKASGTQAVPEGERDIEEDPDD